MTTKEMYRAAAAHAAAEGSAFLDALSRALAFFRARYGDRAISKDGEAIVCPRSLEEESGLHELFDRPVVDYILFCLTGERDYRSEALVGADDAYRTRWRDRAAGRNLRKEAW